MKGTCGTMVRIYNIRILRLPYMNIWSVFFVSMIMMSPIMQANAQNYPCSKSMGGVSHCKDGKFVCKNGKISQSKKVCS